MSRVGGAQGQRPDRAGREAGIDPVCHTLVGAGLARGGLARRTRLGTATLLIGANLPDIDVLSYLWGPAADLAFRRGWTHGVLALALWPFALTATMLLADRLMTRWRRRGEVPGAAPRQLLLLSAVSILSHPVLDTLNTYGVRWLMPFSDRWFYGDTLFIIDPWLWLVLGTGVILGRRGAGPARLALGVAAAYMAVMAVSAAVGRWVATREVAARTGQAVEALMLSPMPLTPFVRTLVATQRDGYRVGWFRWPGRPGDGRDSLQLHPRGDPSHPAVAAAAGTTVGRRFLSWARFPAYRLERHDADRFVVHIVDLRYADRPGASFGAVSIPVSLGRAFAPASDSPTASSPAVPAAPAP